MSLTKKTFKFSFLISLLMCVYSSLAFAQLKVGYIRPSYVFSKYEPYIEAQKNLQEFEKEEMGKLEKEGREFQVKIEDYRKQATLMSEEMQAAKTEELNKQREMLDKSYNELYQTGGILDKKQEELMDPVIKDINEVLMRIGENEEYDFIFDAEQGVLFAGEQYDISDYVLEQLNKGISTQ